MCRMNRTCRRAFTLVELLLVVLILAALAAIAVPRMVSSSTEAKTNACYTNSNLMNTNIELYLVKSGTAASAFDAAALTALLANTAYFPDGSPVCPYATAYVLDATTHHVTKHTH
jgi:general secretion pathway protein G